MNNKIRNVLNIFVGSPSDLQEERTEARNIVDRINKHFARNLNLYIELRGWEDTLPGFSRPQAKINMDVESCDLFVGMLFKRWGTTTGAFSSGFEEEFSIANRRMKDKSLKDIWLFFKDIPKEFLEDPTEQIKKVEAFKEKIVNEKEILYKSFIKSEDWSKLFYDSLVEYIVQEFYSKENEPTSNVPVLNDDKTKIENHETDDSKKIQKTFFDIIHGFDENKLGLINMNTKLRLYLFSTSLIYEDRLPDELLETHQIHLIYLKRDEISPLIIEKKLILRTIITDTFELKTGWFWLQDLETELEDKLILFAWQDQSKDVRLGAVDILIDIFNLKDREILKTWLGDVDDIKIKALKAFEIYGIEDDINDFAKIIAEGNEKVKQAVWQATFAILVRHNDVKANEFLLDANVEQLKSLEYHSQYFNLLIEKQSKEISKNLLRLENDLIRGWVFNNVKESLSIDELWINSIDKNEFIVISTYRELLKRDKEISLEIIEKKFNELEEAYPTKGLFAFFYKKDKDEIVFEINKNKSFDELNKSITWLAKNGSILYEVLAEKFFNEFQEVLNEDLQNGFKRIKDKEAFALDDKINKFVAEDYLLHALKVIKKHSNPIYVELAEKLLNDKFEYYKEEIISNLLDIIENYGNKDDAFIIIKIIKDFPFHTKVRIAKIALKLNPDSEIMNSLANLEDESIFNVVMKFAVKNSKLLNRKELLTDLYNEKDSVRLDILSYMFHFKAELDLDLEKILKNYLSSETYYYNVVTWIDRILYSVEPMRSHYQKILAERLIDK